LATSVAVAAVALPPSPDAAPTKPSAAVKTCTTVQKVKYQKALSAFSRQLAAQRLAYFRKHKRPAARRAFLKAQAAKLRGLKRAAGCQVTPTPPADPPPPTADVLPPASSGPSCSPALSFPGPRAYTHLGPTNYDYYLHATGNLGMLVLFVDFPDAPRSDSPDTLFRAFVPGAARWYSEASYGRLTLAAGTVNSWLRMPKNALAYDLRYRGDWPGIVARHRVFLADAVAVADAQVDFSKYSVVAIVGAAGADHGAVSFAVGTGVVADGHELRGTLVLPAVYAKVPDFVHLTGHLFGLPDNYDFSVPATDARNLGHWDPMSNTGSLSDFLAWVKWKLGWLDSSQIRCLNTTGVFEETLSPVEKPAGVKMIVLPTGGTTAEIVEVHTLLGVQRQVCDRGIIVYSVDVQAPSGIASARIRPARDQPPGFSVCGTLLHAAFNLAAGGLSTYETAFMKVEVLATDGSSYRVRVTRK
jgi:M6 family metalloprotease-like protein